MTDHASRAAEARKGSPFLSTREAAFYADVGGTVNSSGR